MTGVGWTVRVTTFDLDGHPVVFQNFIVYESERTRAIELVRRHMAVSDRQTIEVLGKVSRDTFQSQNIRRGQVRCQ